MITNSIVYSDATRRNWKRLHFDRNGRLMSRANKQLSKKTIVPIEYFANKENTAGIQRFVDFFKSEDYPVDAVLFSVGVNLLKKAQIYDRSHVKNVLNEYLAIPLIPAVEGMPLPSDEFDVLGLIYQSSLLEGEKNRKGSYYTPLEVARNMVKNLDFSKGQTFFDPCCGSGAFILALEGAKPSQIFACDNDPIAVMIAKINLLLKFPDEEFEPQICCCDYLNDSYTTYRPYSSNRTYDYIISNPPWGAVIFDDKNNPISTKESFSFFFEKAFNQLENDGVIRFLLPESVLNVKTHRKFRKFLLENTDIQSITRYPGTFSGVQTKYIDIKCARYFDRSEMKWSEVEKSSSNVISVKDFSTPFHSARNDDGHVSIKAFYLTKNLNFNLLTDSNLEKVQKILAKGKYTLKDSIWALGVITGDNKNKVKSRQSRGMEPIYTGKEIEAYTLKKSTKFIKYERSDFQQVAKDEIYRADEKLVYKFISKNLVFAYDDSKSLFLNSANILIPRIPGMSIKTVLAFLNSEIFKFLYKSLFGEIKILKGNLMELPFPVISAETDQKLAGLVDEVLKGNKNAVKEIDVVINQQLLF